MRAFLQFQEDTKSECLTKIIEKTTYASQSQTPASCT